MTTTTHFMDVLKDETSPSVIFGHIHRRSKEIARALSPLGVSVEYSLADAVELLDLTVIRHFSYCLSPLQAATADERLENNRSNLALFDAGRNAGLSYAARLRANELGSRLARHCTFGADLGGYDVYYEINPLDSDVQEAA